MTDAIPQTAPTNANPDTLIGLLLDETGSMLGIKDATIEAVNGFVKSQETGTGEARVSLSLFNTSKWELRCDAVPAKDFKPLAMDSYRPAATTPLFDAIHRKVAAMEKWIAEKAWAGKVLLAVQSDGEENSSREHAGEHAGENGRLETKKMLERKQGDGWTVLFLGAGLDAARIGVALGVPVGNTVQYAHSGRGTMAAMATMSANVHDYRAKGVAGQSMRSVFGEGGAVIPDVFVAPDPAPTAKAQDLPEGQVESFFQSGIQH